jgi:hypothetical protein
MQLNLELPIHEDWIAAKVEEIKARSAKERPHEGKLTMLIVGLVLGSTGVALDNGFGISKYAREKDRIPSLGDVMADANGEGLFHWWGLFFPGLILVLIIMAVYFVGDGLRDALDPTDGRGAARRRRRRAAKRNEPPVDD